MTKVNFYQVKGDTQAVMRLSCQLVEKAWQMNNDIFIYAPDESTAATMSENLWHWSAASFLPHRNLAHPIDKHGPESIRIYAATNTADEASEVGIANNIASNIASNIEELIGGQHGLLINLAADTPDWFSRFEMLCEFVWGDEESVAQKRKRYKFYKDRGYPLNYHNMTDRF